MSGQKYCPKCGSAMLAADRFCGECGFDTQTTINPGQTASAREPAEQNIAMSNMSGNKNAAISNTRPKEFDPGITTQSANRNALLVLISILLLVFLGGGGLYWWLNQGEEPAGQSISQSGQAQEPVANTDTVEKSVTDKLDLSRASTYLTEPGLKCSFYVNYPDGTSGQTERYSARVVPNEVVRVSDVETVFDNDQEIGGGTHYVERADGIYIIYDNIPTEISPLLRNNLGAGMSWDYTTEYGSIIWTVMDMGVTLDLGFTQLENCLLVQEDNQAVGVKTIVYYAPGMGKVMEKYPNGGDVLKLTAYSLIDPAQAAEKVKQWLPNYQIIQDDRTQS